ncbi:MAG TPA: MFS transporter [Caulobacteraceae bacterium]|jgi:GPH family glycoside/pentoside/hexuronide:cation symporter|nr:MFS transporter [Caulobacteraceae bacterium]
MADSRAMPSADSAYLRRTPLSLGFKAIYGAGTLADSIVQTALNLFLFFYLTAVCGLSNGLAGLSLFVALAVDAVGDPLVGSLSDNSWTRWGRRHPFMLAGAFPLAAALGLLFSVPAGLTGWRLFTYATVCSIAVRVSHSVFLLPYTALGAELSDDYAERTNIAAARILFTVVGTFACVALGMVVFMGGPGGLLRRAGYVPFAWFCAAIGLVGALIAIFGTLSGLPRLHRVAPARLPLAVQFVRDIAELFRNRSFVVLFITLLLLFTGQGVSAALTLHATKFFWNLPPTIIQAITLAAPLGILVGVPVSVLVSNRFEKRRVVLWALLALTAYYGVMPVLQILHVLPTGVALWATLIVMTVGVGAVTACAAISFNSMMADAADEHEAKFGTRREALYFAGLNFAAKAASGLGSLVAGLGLDAIGFPTNLAAHGAQIHIAGPVVRQLGLIVGPGVGSIFAVAIAVFAGYRLDRSAYARIQRSLDERRRAAAT